MSLYSLYDSMPWTKDQAKRGGLKRAQTGKRDIYGRFLPDSPCDTVSFPEDFKHGVAGGRARAIKAKRNQKGQFTK